MRIVSRHSLAKLHWVAAKLPLQERTGEMADELILVNESDEVVGYSEKLRAHEGEGMLHRAFSIFIYNSAGEMLIQRRAQQKYHFGGVWANTCCSHALKDEPLEETAHRRLQHELGFDTALEEAFSFIYKAQDPSSGLVEHELDHVFVGQFDGTSTPHPDEIDAVKWIAVANLQQAIVEDPQQYAPWLRIALERLEPGK